MFRVLTPIIRSSYNCNYSFWHWSVGSATILSRWVGISQQRERMVVDPVNQYQKLYYSCTCSWWWVSTPETCRAAYRNVLNRISRILLDNYEILFVALRTIIVPLSMWRYAHSIPRLGEFLSFLKTVLFDIMLFLACDIPVFVWDHRYIFIECQSHTATWFFFIYMGPCILNRI